MTDHDLPDPIEKLARAYQKEHGGASEHASRTRARILSNARQRQTERGWMLAAAALLLTLVSIPTAWALYTGRLSFSGSEESPPTPTTPSPTTEATRPIELAIPEESEPETTLVPAGEVVDSLEARESPTETSTGISIETGTEVASADEPTEARPPIDPAERRAYEDAHALHFDARDPGGAVEAWDRYLSRYPRGRFAPEARYNRALSLVRLDRRDEAIEALRPFARGSYGTYRRRESTELLEALGAAP